ncbi:MAG: class I SAM-dependent DNA methyltransferase, partial [Pyrobaculum sp.]
LDSEEEAYYLSGILNSLLTRFIVASYVIETSISTHIVDYVNIPKFDPNNPIHIRISQLSKRAHELAKCIHAEVKPDYCRELRSPKEELTQVEEEIDRLVAELYGIPEDALRDIKGLLAILKAEEAPDGGAR